MFLRSYSILEHFSTVSSHGINILLILKIQGIHLTVLYHLSQYDTRQEDTVASPKVPVTSTLPTNSSFWPNLGSEWQFPLLLPLLSGRWNCQQAIIIAKFYWALAVWKASFLWRSWSPEKQSILLMFIHLAGGGAQIAKPESDSRAKFCL